VAWEALKKAMTKNPVLIQPRSDRTFVLETDASIVGLGAVLSQKDESGVLKPCAYASRKLLAQETRYSTRELEALAIIFGIEKFEVYLRTNKFLVLTDHSSLQWLMKQETPKGRFLNWAYRLRQFDFEIIYRPGSENTRADSLSRLIHHVEVARVPFYTKKIATADDFAKKFPKEKVVSVLVGDPEVKQSVEQKSTTGLVFPLHHRWRPALLSDKYLGQLVRKLEGQDVKMEESIRKLVTRFEMINGVLCYKEDGVNKAVVPMEFRRQVITVYHNDAMAGHRSPVQPGI